MTPAVRIVSPQFADQREALVEAFVFLLTPQDASACGPHFAIQNKVSTAEARNLLAQMSGMFRPRRFKVVGLAAWRRRGAPGSRSRSTCSGVQRSGSPPRLGSSDRAASPCPHSVLSRLTTLYRADSSNKSAASSASLRCAFLGAPTRARIVRPCMMSRVWLVRTATGKSGGISPAAIAVRNRHFYHCRGADGRVVQKLPDLGIVDDRRNALEQTTSSRTLFGRAFDGNRQSPSWFRATRGR